MKKAFSLLALLALAVVLAKAAVQQKPTEEEPRFAPARVLETTEAAYPVTSIAAGTVVLEVIVSASGEIEEVKVVRGIASLTEAAERAVRRWRFAPATLDGRPVRSAVPVAFTFNRPVVNP
jgi:TonB family protein